ncbi:MAG: nucleotide sugar dehydrogenase [Desulfovibrio sp.]|nr:nucleotide sugar dehydrogenase [Desulfovibrio sp.]
MTTFAELLQRKKAVAVVGLGYVGLPLALAFARKYAVIGFDINKKRIEELRQGMDHTLEADPEQLRSADIEYSDDPDVLARAGVIIIAVPTPIDSHRNPDLEPVIGASRLVGARFAPGAIIVYESTVYPGLTEEVCVPILERESGLACNRDFAVGYSPERINPGDKVHTLATITKIVSASTPEALAVLQQLYGSIVSAGIHTASSIKVAEAAKVIENTQRDLNIALMNELAIIFSHMGLDTREVLAAAGSKWNFLPFRPGLVGGHCIGVDPYYLTYKAEALGFHPEVILAGRRINDRMGKYLAETTVKRMIRAGRRINGSRIGILGLTFKENVPDLRNTRVVDVIRELEDYGAQPLVHDPLADADEAAQAYGIALASLAEMRDLDALILAVAHDEYKKLTPDQIKAFFGASQPIVVDAQALFNPAAMAAAGIDLWRL